MFLFKVSRMKSKPPQLGLYLATSVAFRHFSYFQTRRTQAVLYSKNNALT